MSDTFAPPGESALDLWTERSNLDGVVLAGVAYGIFFTITLQTVLLSVRPGNLKASLSTIAYICVIFILSTIGFGANVKFNQMTYIDDRNIQGGPNAFTVEYYQNWINIMGFTSYTIMSWVADGLVLWRFTLIWNYNYLMAIFPGIVYLGSVGSSIGLIVAMTRPNANFWIPKVVKLGISYWSLSISLNIILTLLIVGRLVYIRRRVRGALGKHHSSTYTSVMAMLIESAALYSVWGLVFIICYARNTPFQNLLLPALGQVQGIAPVLILFRVAQGRAWSRKTVVAAQLSVSARNKNMVQPTKATPLSDVTVTVFTDSDNNSGHALMKETDHGSVGEKGVNKEPDNYTVNLA